MTQSIRQLKSFASLFPKRDHYQTREGLPAWRVRSSGTSGEPEDAPITAAITSVLHSAGVKIERGGISGMCAADLYTLEADFLDGGLGAETGNYLYQPKGAYVRGARAALFITLGLGLKVPGEFLRQHALASVTLKELQEQVDAKVKLSVT
jgi:hypothetical protein